MKPHIRGRWHAQGLDAPRFSTGTEVIRHLGAVQSQLHDMSLWAIGRRCGRTLVELQAEFDAGNFLRTHVLRPTWHHVAADDLHWFQALTAPRVHQLDAPQRRQLGIDDALLADVRTAAPEVLAGGPLTRAALVDALLAVGVQVSAPQMPHLAMHLETQQLVASGAMQGSQHTYQLLPPAPTLPDHDTLLADVAARYGRGHGAFRDRDLAWWASLTLTQARRAIDLAGLACLSIDGDTYAVPDAVVDAEAARVTLLSNYDEYISYARDPDDFAAFSGVATDIMRGVGLLLVDGRLVGRWTRTIKATTVAVAVVGISTISAPLRAALEAETEAFGTFLGRDARLTIEP